MHTWRRSKERATAIGKRERLACPYPILLMSWRMWRALALFLSEWSLPVTKTTTTLRSLAAMWVHPDFRRRGVGHSLVAQALAFLRSSAQQHVSLWVTETHTGVFQFYESLGFQRTGARSPLRPGSDTTILEMVRPLVD